MSYIVNNLLSANIVLTSNCNSRCLSCNYWKTKPKTLDKEKVYSFFEMVNKKNCSSVVLTGGEPMLHPDFKEIVITAKENYNFIIILSTNGSLVKQHFDDVKDYIDSYCISFDGCNKEQYELIRGMDNYSTIINNIDIIKRYNENIQIWLSFFIQYRNYKIFIDIYKASVERGADGIFFNVPELRDNCFGRNGELGDQKNFMLDKIECRELNKIIEKMCNIDNKYGFLCQNQESLLKFIDYFRIHNGENKPEPRKCFVPYNTITLNEKGKISPCFYLGEEFEMTGNDVNSNSMIEIRKKLSENEEYRKMCDYCCQFNS